MLRHMKPWCRPAELPDTDAFELFAQHADIIGMSLASQEAPVTPSDIFPWDDAHALQEASDKTLQGGWDIVDEAHWSQSRTSSRKRAAQAAQFSRMVGSIC